MTTNEDARAFKGLHKPGKPLVVTNIHDALSARTVGELPSCRALATGSFAVARVTGLTDDELTLEANLAAVKGIAAAAKDVGKPLTVDIQDAYGSQLEEAIGKLLDLGVVGINLEDVDKESGKQYSLEGAAERVSRALKVATDRGVADFVVNARCDTFIKGGGLDDVLARGKAYLAAGATTVFVWGASRGVSTDEVKQMVEAFGGRLNVLLKGEGGLTVEELGKLGVARISMGPTLQIAANEALKNKAEEILKQQAS